MPNENETPTRIEQYLAKAAGEDAELPSAPMTRIEQYLAKIAGEDVELPEETYTRIEQYLKHIAENGGGGGGGETVLINNKNISANGEYSALSDGADGYKKVTVAVPVPTLESKSIGANGTYTPEAGKAWNEVVVDVTAGLPAYVTKIKEYTQAENWLSDTYGNAKNLADTYMDATDMTENRFRIAYVSNNNATHYQASVLWVWKKGASTVSAEGYYKNNYAIRSYNAGASFWISAGAKITVIYLSDTYRDPAGV